MSEKLLSERILSPFTSTFSARAASTEVCVGRSAMSSTNSVKLALIEDRIPPIVLSLTRVSIFCSLVVCYLAVNPDFIVVPEVGVLPGIDARSDFNSCVAWKFPTIVGFVQGELIGSEDCEMGQTEFASL